MAIIELDATQLDTESDYGRAAARRVANGSGGAFISERHLVGNDSYQSIREIDASNNFTGREWHVFLAAEHYKIDDCDLSADGGDLTGWMVGHSVTAPAPRPNPGAVFRIPGVITGGQPGPGPGPGPGPTPGGVTMEQVNAAIATRLANFHPQGGGGVTSEDINNIAGAVRAALHTDGAFQHELYTAGRAAIGHESNDPSGALYGLVHASAGGGRPVLDQATFDSLCHKSAGLRQQIDDGVWETTKKFLDPKPEVKPT